MPIDDTQRELISAWCDGEVSDEERSRVETLLDADPDARAYANDMTALSSLIGDMSTPEAPPGFWQEMHRSVEADIGHQRRRYRRRATLAGLAAAAVLVLIALPTVFRSDTLPTDPSGPEGGGLEQNVGPGDNLGRLRPEEPVATFPIVGSSLPIWSLSSDEMATSSPWSATTTSTTTTTTSWPDTGGSPTSVDGTGD